MTTTILTSNQSTTFILAANGDQLFVQPGVTVSSTNGDAIDGTFGVNISILGSAVGAADGIQVGLAGQTTDIVVGSQGSVIGASGDYGLRIAGTHDITNDGLVECLGGHAYALDVNGPGKIVNYGSIVAADPSGRGVNVEDTTSSDVQTFDNFGTITGTGCSFFCLSETEHVVNAGTMTGDVFLGYGLGSTFDSSFGQVFGTINAGVGSAGCTIIGATNGGLILGSTGSDNLQANRSQTAANNHVTAILNGGGGSNALYGGSAFTTFVAGNSAGGHNQIHGGLSLMTDVTGYANNTLDFSGTPSGNSVYVDLLNGHNAYLYANANHTGALTFEDSIQNVPNVIGSAGGDVIRADNGTDVIRGGGGADILYAGTGVDTFVYSGYADSNTVKGYDTVVGFVTGKDKLDLSAFNLAANNLAIKSSSATTTLYLEQTPGTFNSATDLAISFQGANAVKAGDVIF